MLQICCLKATNCLEQAESSALLPIHPPKDSRISTHEKRYIIANHRTLMQALDFFLVLDVVRAMLELLNFSLLIPLHLSC
ncbi:unnamed protein product [Sphagnum troendelagicum]